MYSGYSGGLKAQATYEQVCSGKTGHAEVVQVTFDEKKLPYQDLLKVFFYAHDPTTPNRQGHDVGSQYRSVIFYHDEAQKKTALELIQAMNKSGVGIHGHLVLLFANRHRGSSLHGVLQGGE